MSYVDSIAETDFADLFMVWNASKPAENAKKKNGSNLTNSQFRKLLQQEPQTQETPQLTWLGQGK